MTAIIEVEGTKFPVTFLLGRYSIGRPWKVDGKGTISLADIPNDMQEIVLTIARKDHFKLFVQ